MGISLHKQEYYVIDNDDDNGPPLKMARVTSILDVINKPALMGWMEKITKEGCLDRATALYGEIIRGGAKIEPTGFKAQLTAQFKAFRARSSALDKAANIGKEVHKYIEWAMRHELGLADPTPPPVTLLAAQQAIDRWESWREGVQLKPLFAEATIYHPLLRYAGTSDLVCEYKGDPAIIDWKTGSGVYVESHLQTAAYARGWEAMGHGPIKRCMTVKIPKTPEEDFIFGENPNIQAAFALFQHAQQLWFMQKLGLEKYTGDVEQMAGEVFA